MAPDPVMTVVRVASTGIRHVVLALTTTLPFLTRLIPTAVEFGVGNIQDGVAVVEGVSAYHGQGGAASGPFAGDELVAVAGESTSKLTYDGVVNRIRTSPRPITLVFRCEICSLTSLDCFLCKSSALFGVAYDSVFESTLRRRWDA